MKVAIMTLTGDNNYGNKLQNFAIQYQLNKLKCNVTTIRVTNKRYLLKALLSCIFLPFTIFVKKYKNKIIRAFRFFQFNWCISQDYSNVSPQDLKRINKKLSKYDKIFYGSDQIWNPEMKTFGKAYLGFCSPKEKNYAISASFGSNSIDDEYVDLFYDGLRNFEKISVRETIGKKIVYDISGLDAMVLSDPTLTVPVEEWAKREKKVKTPKRYMLIYFLGEESKEVVQEIAERNELPIINANFSQPYGPAEFLYLIHNAALVCTDSFHACVFSILFGVQFYIFARNDKYKTMNSRIDTLLQILGIEGQKEKSYMIITQEEIYNLEIKKRINVEKEKFIYYLNDIILN